MRSLLTALLALLALAAMPTAARAAFPYIPKGADPHDYTQYHNPPGDVPGDLKGSTVWKYAATPEPGNVLINAQPQELHGVRGAHVADADPRVATAWEKTTGRPDVDIAVLDSGIEWNDRSQMTDLRDKVHLNRGELPVPNHRRSTPLMSGVDCSTYRHTYDADGDGVFDLADYACDTRVSDTSPSYRAGPEGFLTPQDLIIAFSNGRDNDHNGYVDDIAGWDFMDNDNDPYDDVHYGHGTHQAKYATAEADNGGDVGACPNCMVTPIRVGNSFIADSNRFAAGTTYAVDHGSDVVSEALGAIDNTRFARQAVDYAYHHGVAVIASAADEAAQHHNYPSNLPHTIVVNSVTKYDTLTPIPHSYLQLNGCTNFGTKVDLSIPSTSCSSEATGRSSGMAGLIYSAARDAVAEGRLKPATDCARVGGGRCPITADEVAQLMASGSIDGRSQADDVNFAGSPEPTCSPKPTPTCTDPNSTLENEVMLRRPFLSPIPGSSLPIPGSKSYPARKGYDAFYGYGRVNAARAVDALLPDQGPSMIPPTVAIDSPDWYTPVDPRDATQAIGAQVSARGAPYTCRVEVAPGSYPNNASSTARPPGDFATVPSAFCDGHTAHTAAFHGVIAHVDLAALAARFPPGTKFLGNLTPAARQAANGRPNAEPQGFTVRVVATTTRGATTLTGRDRRTLFLNRDASTLPGFPKHLSAGGESSPLLIDLNGDNRAELVYATGDGLVHAIEPDGRELPGWPVRTDRVSFVHRGAPAFRSGKVSGKVDGPIIGALSAGDLRHDGGLDVVAADFEGHVYAWNARGKRIFTAHTNPDYSGRPLKPFHNVRVPTTGRTQRGFLTAPVVADLDGDGRPEIIAAAMDRHLYAWHANGHAVAGFPVEPVDPDKVQSIDPKTGQVTFKPDGGATYDQGAIVDTPAVGDINADGKPEIVVGTNEEYKVDQDGGLNVGTLNTTVLSLVAHTGLLTPANDRLYAISARGNRAPGGAILPGWPFKVASVDAELLPVVGDGITGSPVIAPIRCLHGGPGPKVGVMPSAGAAYLLNGDGTSCYGTDPTNGKPTALNDDLAIGLQRRDLTYIPSAGQPAFGAFPGGTAFLAPSAGLIRALDDAENGYQGGQDVIGAWYGSNGQFVPGFPAQVDDLQFLTGPTVADIDGKPGEEVLGGSASLDLNAFSSATGQPVPGWPKLTTDWMIASPTVGSFGAGAHKDVIGLTRSGELFAYQTRAPACSPSSWPRFHHDIASSGNISRDATPPGKPYDAELTGDTLRFRAPGDDLLCGRATRYEAVESNRPIHPARWSSYTALPGAPTPAASGTQQTLALPAEPKRHVAIRAVDEQGNVGPALILRTRR